MPDVLVVTETELRAIVPLDVDAVSCVEQAFSSLSQGHVVMPPILSMPIAESNGEIDVKTAFVPGLDQFAVKMSPGFFDNPKLGLASTNGLMVVFSSKTGLLEALLLDNGWLTDVRTAAAGAVAAKHLSREDSRIATIVGTGLQARMQLQALRLVRNIEEVRVWGRSPGKAEAMAQELNHQSGMSCRAVPDLGEAVNGSDILVTTTPAQEPLIKAEWLEGGMHVTAMGSDQETKNELEPNCLAKADLYVPDRVSQTRLCGELRAAIENRAVLQDTGFPELGDIVYGKHPGRTSAGEITIADLTGTGVQDTAIANLSVSRTKKAGSGTKFET